VAQTTPATSTAGDRLRDDRGYALYELILALAILGLVAGVVYPRVAKAPGPTELAAASQRVAAVLRSDRNAALRERREVVTAINLKAATIASGGPAGMTVGVPRGMKIELVQSDREATEVGGGIRFLPNGGSSGGAITLSRGELAYQVSVNWLTGGVTIARRTGAGS
jgi:general secretion pathway protein H